MKEGLTYSVVDGVYENGRILPLKGGNKNMGILCVGGLFFILFLAGCADLLQAPEAPGPETAKVTLTVGSGPGRTVAPSLRQFEKITLTFTGQNGSVDLPPVDVIDGSVEIWLPKGSWSVAARAYHSANAPPVAEAVNDLSYDGEAITGSTRFVLQPTGTESGILKYTITVPEGVTLADSGSRIQIARDGGVVETVTITAGGVHAGELSLDGGRYVADILLKDKNDHTAVYLESAVILSGLFTELAFAPKAGDFLDPEVRAAMTDLTDGDLTFGAKAGDTGVEVGELVLSGSYTLGIEAPYMSEKISFTLTKTAEYSVAVDSSDVSVDDKDGLATFEVDISDISGTAGTKTFTLTITKEGMSGTPVAVTVALTGVPTADIGFAQTVDNSSDLDNSSITVNADDPSAPTWDIDVVEKAVLYFAVNKEAGQTITVTGTDADRVTQAAVGDEVDGSTATEELAIFAVETERWDADTRTSSMFYGTGDFTVAYSPGNVPDEDTTLTFAPISFNLVVSEEERVGKTVGVTVNVDPDLTGVAVFKVEEDEDGNGSLTREDIPNKDDPTEEGTRLVDAIAWINTQYTAPKTGVGPVGTDEYLVRVEDSEAIPISGIGVDAIVRLRGHGTTERVISHNGVAYPGTSSGADYAFIMANTTLALEDKVTIKGLGYDATPGTSGKDYSYQCLIYNSGVFYMRAGSRLTEFNCNAAAVAWTIVFNNAAGGGSSVYYAKFLMEGGSIDHNKLAKKTNANPITYINNSTLEGGKELFIKTGGTVTDNVRIASDGTREENFANAYIHPYKKEVGIVEFER